MSVLISCFTFYSEVKSLWRPEYAAYMIEGTPGKPYGGLTAHFNVVEANMKYRREEVEELLEKDEILMCLTAFPRYIICYFFFSLLMLFVSKITLEQVFVSMKRFPKCRIIEVGKNFMVNFQIFHDSRKIWKK